MSACCDVASDRKAPMLVKRARETFAWVLPSAILVLVPKCPMCLAAHVALWTGLGVSLSTATYLRHREGCCSPACASLRLPDCGTSGSRRGHIFRYFTKETEPCNTKS